MFLCQIQFRHPPQVSLLLIKVKYVNVALIVILSLKPAPDEKIIQ